MKQLPSAIYPDADAVVDWKNTWGVTQQEIDRVRGIHNKYANGLFGKPWNTYFASRFHDGNPYFLIGVAPGTPYLKTLMPDELEGVPVYYQFREHLPSVTLRPRLRATRYRASQS